MAIFDDTDRVIKWKYVVKKINILIPNTDAITIPNERLNGLEIEENYEEYYFPVIKLSLVLDSDTYYKILQNKNDCNIFLRIDKFSYVDGSEEQSLDKEYIKDTFELIIDENTEDMLRSLKEDESSSDYTKTTSDVSEDSLSTPSNNKVEFYLFKSTIDGTKTNVNKVLHKANVADAIAYLATVAKLKNLVMAQPDNTTVYDQLLIPPLSVLKALAFIDTYYGIYKTGSIIWFGMDYTYIIPFSGACDVYVKNEIKTTNIIIPKSVNTSHINSLGSLKKKSDKNNNYVIGDYSSVNISNQSISNNYLNANDIQTVDSYDDSTSTNSSKAKSKKTNFVKIFTNKTENSFISSMYTAQTNAKSDVVSVRLQDYDVSVISPNKRCNVIFEDSNYTKKYNGNY